jgi:hypothetical protein
MELCPHHSVRFAAVATHAFDKRDKPLPLRHAKFDGLRSVLSRIDHHLVGTGEGDDIFAALLPDAVERYVVYPYPLRQDYASLVTG